MQHIDSSSLKRLIKAAERAAKAEAYLDAIKILGTGVTLPWARTLLRDKLDKLQKEIEKESELDD
jgi:hypothetical protein